MYANHTVAAVIPAYNEEGFIGEVIRTLPSFIDRAYVIDDGSTDGTWEEINDHVVAPSTDGGVAINRATPSPGNAVPKTPHIVPIQHQQNRGVGGAIKTGYRRALADGMDVTTVIAGDGQTEPDIVERIVAPVANDRADYSKGNRMLTREGMPPLRQIGNFMLGLLTKIASGYWKVNDPQNGSTAISREVLETIDIDELYNGYGFANDLLVRLNVYNFRVADVPRRAVYKEETSHIEFRSFVVTVSWLLLRRFLWRLRIKHLERDFHPLAFLYLFGSMIAGFGLLSSIRDIGNDKPARTNRGSILFVFGWLFMILAMVFDHQDNEELQEIADRPPSDRQ